MEKKRFFKVIDSDGVGFGRDFTGHVLELVHTDAYNIKGYHCLKQPAVDNKGNKCVGFVCMQEGTSIIEVTP